jgi:hypothetical protein
VLGAILNIGIARFATGSTASRVHDVLESPSGLMQAAGDPLVQDVLARALHLTYWGVLTLALLASAMSWLIPIERRLSEPATRR